MQAARRKGYWKFIASLLKHDEYCNDIKHLMQQVSQDNTLGINFTAL